MTKKTKSTKASDKPLLYGPDDKPLLITAPERSKEVPARPTARTSQEKEDKTKKRIPWLRLILGMATLFGGFVALLGLFPRLSVNNDAPINLSDPFSTPFHVTNEGYLPLFNVRLLARNIEVRSEDGGGRIAGDAYATDWKFETFWPKDEFDFNPETVIKSRGLTYVSLDIVVQYSILPKFRKREKVFHFTTQLGSDNHLHWMRRQPD